MHEQIPDIKRLQCREYDEAITEYSTSGWWSPVKFEGSTLNPDAPWNHVFHVAVRSSDARHWWSEQYLWQASQVVLKLKPLTHYLENDAPIAASAKDHASTAYVPPPIAKTPWPKSRPEARWSTQLFLTNRS